MPLLGAALVGSSPHLWDPSRQERRGHPVVRCDFCGSATARWHYSVSDGRGWRACQTCHRTIEADDREALVERVVLSNRRLKLPRSLCLAVPSAQSGAPRGLLAQASRHG